MCRVAKFEGNTLTIGEHSFEGNNSIVRNLGDDCQIETLQSGVFSSNFMLTPEDVDVLHNCPLKKIDMFGTSCFTPLHDVDLSNLTNLETLNLNHCYNKNFTITGLPASLRTLYIEGLTEENFQLNKTGKQFGSSLEKVKVSKLSMCPIEMFNVECYVNGVPSDIGHDCNLTDFVFDPMVSGDPSPYQYHSRMNTDVVHLLQQCPLREIRANTDYYWTDCISSHLIDLSNLTTLQKLDLNYCMQRELEFTITGLPTSLQILDIVGFSENNIQLVNPDDKFGDSMREINVGNASMCCPEPMLHMFGRDMSHVKCQFKQIQSSWHFPEYEVLEINCGLSESGKELFILRNEDISFLMLQRGRNCQLTRLFVNLPEFTMLQQYIDILAGCPLTELYLVDSQCFSGPVDLRKLVTLTHLHILACRSSQFLITGLPAMLKRMNIPGLAEFNVDLHDVSNGFGDSLAHLVVICISTYFP